MSVERNSGGHTALLALGALGIVFGDIGTSPLYALAGCFTGAHLAVSPDNVFGVLSLIFWTITLVVLVKYVLVVLNADNKGEGGVLALTALVVNTDRESPRKKVYAMLGILGAALFFADGAITPAISVLSAVEGLQIAAPASQIPVLPITLLVLIGLFMIQKHGTGSVGRVFGPVMLGWFVVLGVMGASWIVREPRVLLAINPIDALSLLGQHRFESLAVIAGVFLTVTGGEALYADMGHFGKKPIRYAWVTVAMPALLLNYFGQGAMLIEHPQAISNPFYLMAPSWALLPLVLLATAATVIASQAVISGAYSLANQSVQMGFMPRIEVRQTSDKAQGQIYVPFTNWVLYLAVIYLVFTFQSSSNLAAAYGIAVTGTMTITTVLITFVMVLYWRWPLLLIVPLIAVLFTADLTFFAANAMKIPQGGWFPLGMAVISFTVLTTWKRGRKLLFEEIARQSVPMQVILDDADNFSRVEGTAVFLTNVGEGAPSALLHNIKHNKVLHERNILLTVIVEDKPYVTQGNRLLIDDMGKGFYRVRIFYGFMDRPDLPEALNSCATLGLPFDMMSTSFFISRAMIVSSANPGMVKWRERLFLALSKNAMNAADFFKIPTNRVIEMGTRIEI